MLETKIKITIEVPENSRYNPTPFFGFDIAQGKGTDLNEIRQTALLDMVEINTERKIYFERFINQYTPDDALLLANSEAIMDAIRAYIDLRKPLPEGFTWHDITQQVRDIFDDFQHKLPMERRKLHTLFIRYTREGFEALIQ